MSMNTNKLQAIKMAWLAAEERGDTPAKLALLSDHPDLQDELIEFVAAYHITSPAGSEPELLSMTKRAMQTALTRVLNPQTLEVPAPNLRTLRSQKGVTLVVAARGLRLSIDVWKKFEDGLIELNSLGERQLARLASYFQVTSEQFGAMLNQSTPAHTLNRRQTARAAEQEHTARQSFAEALTRSTMSSAEKQLWQEKSTGLSS
jgi:hypothetical protein